MDEAFQVKDVDALRHWRQSSNPAARDYAEDLLDKLLPENKA